MKGGLRFVWKLDHTLVLWAAASSWAMKNTLVFGKIHLSLFCRVQSFSRRILCLLSEEVCVLSAAGTAAIVKLQPSDIDSLIACKDLDPKRENVKLDVQYRSSTIPYLPNYY